MSVKKWQQLAEEKTVLDKQTEEIHPKIQNERNKQRVWSAFRGRVF